MSSSSSGVRVCLLGRFEVERDGETIPSTSWKRRRPVELLTALALAPGHVLHREEIIDRMWPEKDLDAGANNLYRTLHELRRIAGEDLVRTERGVVRLAEDTWVDVDAFERAVASGEPAALTTALELYRGALLPDDPYGDAIQARREGLRQRFVDAGLRLTRHHEDPDEQIDVLRRILEVDASLEEAHRALMRALATTGRTKDALRQYGACVEALRKHLDSEPSAETTELRNQIEAGKIAAAPATAAPKVSASPRRAPGPDWRHVARRLLGTDEPPNVRGRAEAVRRTRDFAAGEAGLLIIEGEAGLGKSRLAVECARTCGERGDATLVGLGYEFEGTAPYTPFVDAWSDHLAVAGRPPEDNPFFAFVPVPGASAQEDRIRLFQSVEESIRTLAGDHSVCLVLEDLHQADESSLYLLYHLARAVRHLPLKLVVTARSENIQVGSPLHTVLTGLRRERLARSIWLETLPPKATAELVADVAGRPLSDEVVEAVHALCEGNPFFTEEVVQLMLERGEDARPEASADLLRTIRERISNQGPDTERLLVTAAVEGLRFHFQVAREAAGLEEAVALDALDRGLDARIIEEHGSQYRFRHALTRDALYDSLSHTRRVYVHRTVANALEALPGDAQPELLAHHHKAAGQLDRALPHLMAAADRARGRLGFGEAVGFCEQALDLMDTMGVGPGEDRFRVLKSMGEMRIALGDAGGAVRNLDAAAEMGAKGGWQPSAVDRSNALRLGGLALIESGYLDRAEAHLDASLEALADEPESPVLTRIYYLFSQLRWHQGRHTDAYALAEQCLLEAERHDDVEAIAKGYEMLALACHSLGDWKKGTDYEQKRSELAGGSLDVASAFDVHL